MFARHLLFWTLSLLGIGTVTSQLLPPQRRAPDPKEHRPQLDGQDDFDQVVSAVNREFREYWHGEGLEPSPPASDLTVARRLSLGLTGTIPSLEEIRFLEQVEPSSRTVWWLDHILADRRYSDYTAERLARAFVGTEDGPFLVFRRRRFVTWLSDCLYENQPYDQIVRSLISDRGLWTDSPAVNFVTVTNGTNEEGQPDEARLGARTARAFLGVRLDCVQCHDDNLGGDWQQSDFHQLAAFFSEARSSLLGIRDAPRDYKFQYLGSEEQETISPKVPFEQALFGSEGPRREQLARWVTHQDNRAFSRTIVNRAWALLFGKPLIDPIDSIPLEGPFPPGLESLAADFAAHGCDLRRLFRVIASTEVFQRSSRSDRVITQHHENCWSAFPLTRLRPEQVAGSVIQAATLSTIDSQSHIVVRFVRTIQLGDFVERYGDTGEDEFGSHGGTIPQRLLMLNGELVKERTKVDLLTNAATRIARLASDDERAVEAAYLVALTRRPTAAEAAHFCTQLKGQRGEQRSQKMEDVCWTLLNSAEFSWNH